MKLLVLISTIILNSFIVFGQQYEFQNFEFSNKTEMIPDSIKTIDHVTILHDVRQEIQVIKDQSIQYSLYHDIIYINSDDAVEKNNRIYIPYASSESLLLTKARVILTNGKIINLNKNDIKEEIDQEKKSKYTYYAVKGLEKGAIIEKAFVLKELPNYTGQTIYFEDDHRILNSKFELIFPKHLIFKTKSYNGIPEAKLLEDKYEDKKVIEIEQKNIKALEPDEPYSNRIKYLQAFKYKLYENTATNNQNINNFKNFTQSVYENLYIDLDKNQSKKLSELVSKIGKANNENDQIRKIEFYLKKNVEYNSYCESNVSFIDALKTRQANLKELIQLYVGIFHEYKIEFNTVFTCNREKVYFDKEFESYEYLGEVMFYFPTTNGYLDPKSYNIRYPFFNSNFGENYGLFLKEKEYAGATMGVSEIKFIQVPEGKYTHDTMLIKVDFIKDINNPKVEIRNIFNGYAASRFQTLKDQYAENDYLEILKNISENYNSKAVKPTITTKYDGAQYVNINPFILDNKFDGKHLIQKAGDKVLFKVGELIGRQMEMYQDSNRVYPMEIDYPHYYTRIIDIILPEGYKVENMQVFKLNFLCGTVSKPLAEFITKFEETKTIYHIQNDEFYHVVTYPIEMYSSYREVVNAAADFNKITLVISR